MRHTRKPCPFSDEEIIAAAFAVAAGDETHQSRIKIADVQRYLIKNNITPTVAGALGDKESIVSGTKISRVLRTRPEYFDHVAAEAHRKIRYYYVRPEIVERRERNMTKAAQEGIND